MVLNCSSQGFRCYTKTKPKKGNRLHTVQPGKQMAWHQVYPVFSAHRNMSTTRKHSKSERSKSKSRSYIKEIQYLLYMLTDSQKSILTLVVS